MGLAHDEIREIIARAVEIQGAAGPDAADLEAVIHAGVEVGIPKSVIERAVRERLTLPMTPPSVGDLTFAKSADDKFYVAEVMSISDETFRVRFLRGSTYTASLDELRPCSLVPGERVVCPWPWWGPWTCTVLSYDSDARRVTVTDGWGETLAFPLREIWLAPPSASTTRRKRVYAALIGVGATVGAAIGSLITALLLR